MLRGRRCTPFAQSRPGAGASPVDELSGLREADARCAFACEGAAEAGARPPRRWARAAAPLRGFECASAIACSRGSPSAGARWRHPPAPPETPAGSRQSRMHARTHARTCARAHMYNHVAPRVSNVDNSECGNAMQRANNCSRIHRPRRDGRIVSAARLQPALTHRAPAQRQRRVGAAIS